MTHFVCIWKEEQHALNTEEHEARSQLKDPSYKWIYEEPSVKQLSDRIAEYEEEFQCIAIKPLRTLRDDLKHWIRNKKESLHIQPPGPIKSVITEMTTSLNRVQTSLRLEEGECLKDGCFDHSAEIQVRNNSGTLKSSGSSEDGDELCSREMGIPDEAWDWASPSAGFLTELLSEFIRLDAVYYERLEAAQGAYDEVRLSNEDNWTEEELRQIHYFSEVFKKHSSTNRRKLCILFLCLILKDRKPSEVERVLDRRLREKQLKDRVYTIRRSWIKARDDLSVRIRAALLQATEMAERKRLGLKHKCTQKEIRPVLRDQVAKFTDAKINDVVCQGI
ncbi:unnamed protein product [Echinostoma caproni]|uniref:Enhancer of polycomb-like protein n=1 Tax=Echinostoma caproni TaxID=27848 RepID=A0A183B1N6_9TREM|nr:unnamed protein product [Echinostoma caproni]